MPPLRLVGRPILYAWVAVVHQAYEPVFTTVVFAISPGEIQTVDSWKGRGRCRRQADIEREREGKKEKGKHQRVSCALLLRRLPCERRSREE